MATPPAQLRRTLGLAQVTASGVGIIIGAGVYVLIGPATELAGPRVWMAFLVAAALSALTGMSYAELASMFPKAGAEFEYTRQAFSARLAFLVGWIMFLGLMVAAAAVALGFARYLRFFVPVPERVGALGLIAVVTLVAWSGIRRSSWLTVLLSTVQVGGLLYVIVIGIPHLGSVDLLSGGDTGAGGVLAAAALVFFAFIGFDEVITLAEETRDASRTVPRALLLALAISTLLYIGVAIAAVSVVGAHALAHAERPLALVLDHTLGGAAAGVVAAIALVATTNTTLLCLTAASRLQYGMADAAALPAPLTRLGPRSGAPYIAIGVAALVAGLFVIPGDLGLIASVTDLAVYLVFLAVNVAVVVLRIRRPDADRPFRSPLRLGRVPVLPVLGIVTVLAVLPALRWEALAIGAAMCLVGLVAERAFRPAPR